MKKEKEGRRDGGRKEEKEREREKNHERASLGQKCLLPAK